MLDQDKCLTHYLQNVQNPEGLLQECRSVGSGRCRIDILAGHINHQRPMGTRCGQDMCCRRAAFTEQTRRLEAKIAKQRIISLFCDQARSLLCCGCTGDLQAMTAQSLFEQRSNTVFIVQYQNPDSFQYSGYRARRTTAAAVRATLFVTELGRRL